MSAKNLDGHNRWRNKTVAFRVSPEEDAQIETAVRLTGLTKQWRGVPFFTISYLSALAGISDDIYESAKIDGRRRRRHL